MTLTQIKLAIYGCIALSALTLAYWLGGQGARADLSDYKTKMIAATAKVADKALETERMVRAGEHAKAAEIASIAEQYEQDKKTNDRKQADLVAGLRAGNVSLHQRWQAAQATAKLSSAAASAAELDAAARDREESAGRIVAAADQCDAQVRGLQEVVRSDRGD